ncbi:hypothetical protein LPJ73_003753 [Coemansia sp. RSA 2703]|nr:hypothetical protein LPJ73_003753 [Coemansia sp. RSA 2703]KAJ2383769.1 hypothetical protein GGI05_005206 [Coemansia sp. RSA 2603]
MGCQKCRGWEESECCLSQTCLCTCACHTSCDCSFCFTVSLKARSSPTLPAPQQAQSHTISKSAASIISTVLRLDSRTSTSLDGTERSSTTVGQTQMSGNVKTKSRWSRRGSTLKPLRLFA